MIQKIAIVIKDHIKDNKFTYLSLFLFYILGIVMGSMSVNDMDYKQKDEMVSFFSGFLKLLDKSNVNQITILKMSLLDNLKIIVIFWLLGFIVIGFPLYYIVIGMRGFSTGFSSGIIMGVLGTKGIIISSVYFLPKEIIAVPCLIALAVNGIKLSKSIIRGCLKKPVSKEMGIKQKIVPYSFVTGFFSVFIFIAILFEAFISAGALMILM